MELSPKKQETTVAPSYIGNLLSEARVLLLEADNPNKTKLEHIVEQFQDQFFRNGTSAELTPERFQEIAKAFRAIDPEFQKARRQQLLQNYPWLDRTIPPQEP